jgi:hypothetical protein
VRPEDLARGGRRRRDDVERRAEAERQNSEASRNGRRGALRSGAGAYPCGGCCR